ncbi:MAG: integrase [Crocinitomicaceae bacterium]|nr:MAG: integrase [Crocinitomicaceae bacterium]
MNQVLQSIAGARWSRTVRSWHIPDSQVLLRDLVKKLPAGWDLVWGEPPVEMEQKLEQKVRVDEKRAKADRGDDQAYKAGKKQKAGLATAPVMGENIRAMQDFLDHLRMKAYSENTIRTYRQEFASLLQLLRTRHVESLTPDEVKRYILYCIDTLKLSENTVHSRLNALKFYFEQVLRRDKIFVEIPRPRKPIILPKVLGEQEISKLFRALDNKKHKALLFTAYSAGLRVSEAVALRISDIDSDRMQILVQQAKGKKDRYVMLSPLLRDILRNYLKTCKPRPREYLFEGTEPGEPMSIRTAQEVFQQAKRKAGIMKQVSFHSLRHSFATHLLEQGIDIKYIKDLLGHFSIHTTTRYLHVKKEQLINIRSPLDEIYQSGDWTF